MTPLLQQARGALTKIDAYFKMEAKHDSNCTCGADDYPNFQPSGCYIHDTLAATFAPLTALDTYEALSEYDKAIHDLAKYLPDGWYAQAPYSTETLLFYKEKPVMLTGTIETWEAVGKSVGVTGVPWHFTWRESPREIRSGRVVQQGEV